jgi:predicted DNA-binding transcriptional regulator AlpA
MRPTDSVEVNPLRVISEAEAVRLLDDPLQVVSEAEAARLLDLSVDTLRRRVRAGDGPPRIALSERRVGYRRGSLAAWLDRRTV